jgi:non-ribosomal peptide synthetase-like protein
MIAIDPTTNVSARTARPVTGEALEHGERRPLLEGPGHLYARFLVRAAEAPHRIALEHQGRSMSYAAVRAQADRLARGLASLGVGRGARVAICVKRSMEAYVAVLGVLASGAAYVPIDPETPPARVDAILRDANVALVLGDAETLAGGRAAPAVDLFGDWSSSLPDLGLSPTPPQPDDECYVIYTSGSTGAPKGVSIGHRSVVHLARVEQELFDVRCDDRVLAGFSLAFDAAVEEIWLAFAAGATLVVADKRALLDDLPRFLGEARISVWSTVPTLLATIPPVDDADDARARWRSLPTVRLLIVGGEACPQRLVDRWADGARAMWNTYGPTEATVIATAERLVAGRPVSLGRPIANYSVYVVRADGGRAGIGEPGELCIGGVGLALGYVGKPALTAERFIANPWASEPGAPKLLYRTGDRGQRRADGGIEFLGRVDEQVKLRGHRIELAEIERAIGEVAGVRAAAARLIEAEDAPPALCGYVVAETGAAIVPGDVARALARTLPQYMVPTLWQLLPAMPTLPSGKVDRRALPMPSLHPPRPDRPPPRGEDERAIARAFAEVTRAQGVGRHDDFFSDLGGDSLSAARAISALRQEPRLASLSMRDLYRNPTPARLARVAARAASPADHARAHAPPVTPIEKSWAARAWMAFGVLAQATFFASRLAAPYFAFVCSRAAGASLVPALAAALGAAIALAPLQIMAAIVLKWSVIGRLEPGRHPIGSTTFARWWAVSRVIAAAPFERYAGSPIMPRLLRALGAKVDGRAFVGSADLEGFDQLTIGRGAAIDDEARVCGAWLDGRELVIAPVTIADGASVETRAIVAPGTHIAEGARVRSLSLVGTGTSVEAEVTVAGVPAAPVAPVHRPFIACDDRGQLETSDVARAGAARAALPSVWIEAGYLFAALGAPAFSAAPWLPAMVLLAAPLHPLARLASAIAAAALGIALQAAWVAVLAPRALPERLALADRRQLRAWIFERAMHEALGAIGALFATRLAARWFAAMGVRVGRGAEISTALPLSPASTSIGEDAFVADVAVIGAPRVRAGVVERLPTRVGSRAFVGNGAVIPPGGELPADTLLGCLSLGVEDAGRAAAAGAIGWLGSPAMALSSRARAGSDVTSANTFRPSRALTVRRALWDGVRIVLPSLAMMVHAGVLVHAVLTVADVAGVPAALVLTPLVSLALGAGWACLLVGAKWLLIGRYRAGLHPLWSTFVFRNELVTALHEQLVDPTWNEPVLGTGAAPWLYRALGARVGRGVFVGTTCFTEYDLAAIGDGAVLADGCTIQTHLFEDRVMKLGAVRIGDGACVGADAIVLYDAEIEPRARLDALSLVMKGERLPADSSWCGAPARRIRPEARLGGLLRPRRSPGRGSSRERPPTPSSTIDAAPIDLKRIDRSPVERSPEHL